VSRDGHLLLDCKYLILVWTPCLMHRCVCIWRYILQNYNYKLHFQNLPVYHIPHVSIGSLATENPDVCTAYDPWDRNIQLTMGRDWRLQIYVGFVADIDIKIVGMPPQARHAFRRQRHMQRGGGGRGGYLYPPRFSSLCHTIHGWMTGRMDGWKDSEKRPRHPLLYVICKDGNCKLIICYKFFVCKSCLVERLRVLIFKYDWTNSRMNKISTSSFLPPLRSWFPSTIESMNPKSKRHENLQVYKK
jgi:hypothetical protein